MHRATCCGSAGQRQSTSKLLYSCPHKVTECDLDLRVGGRFNTVFDVDGQKWTIKVFSENRSRQKLVFTDGYTEGWKPAEKPFMTAILLLEDLGEGKTRYTAIARHPTKRNP